jgi:hypothetical protein
LHRSVLFTHLKYALTHLKWRRYCWYKVLKSQNLEDKLHRLWDELQLTHEAVQLVTLRGEMTGPGVQGNYYKLKDYCMYAFDIEVNGIAIDSEQFMTLVQMLDIQTVPTLSLGVTLGDWLDGRTVKDKADGESVIYKVKREGIVIKPMFEQTDMRLGRVFIKQHSLAYLAKSKL